MAKHTNKLIDETSPYLLQHAHNPVNWNPWNDGTLAKARAENKPILVSIGYAACHWCHVMEKESFEDEAVAAIMNEHFINIKIDREERPDLDHIYMDSVQAMTGSGGWPLNVFLTPEGKPFYGGTYFPPRRAFNRPSWQETLQAVITAFRDKRHEIDAQAENLVDHLLQSNSFGLQKPSERGLDFDAKDPEEIYTNIMKSADKEWGGFGQAPKFPQTFIIQFLLRYHYTKRNTNNRSAGSEGGEAIEQALLSLDKMIEGGIYDQVGGGFSRYSTDTEWLAPHFEKMLYDNALLLSVLSEAYQLTGEERYREVIDETMTFIQRELLHENKGFYAALDADSEGEEGKFYVWEYEEVKKILGGDAPIFCEYYDITPEGNWSHGPAAEKKKNILRVKEPIYKFSKRKNIAVDELKKLIAIGKKKLLEERSKRIRPLLDDKIILGWNALMNTACSKAFEATGRKEYRELAIENMEFILSRFKSETDDEFYHTWKNDIGKYPAFLDDYAFLIAALIRLQEITGDRKWLLNAKKMAEFVIDHFSEEEGFFYYTRSGQTDVIIRKKEVYDGAVASGNSVMADNLYHLSILCDKREWKQRSILLLSSLEKAITRYPVSFGNWACLLQEIISGTNEIVLVGEHYENLHENLLRQYVPHRVLMASKTSDPGFVLLADKPVTDPPSIWLCRDFSCQRPVTSISELITLINRLHSL